MRILRLFSLVCIVAFSAQICAGSESADRGRFSAKDYKFLSHAAQGGIMEVTLGELARKKGSNQAVKNFGSRMVSDHGKANLELQKLTSAKGAVLPSELAENHKQATQHMLKLAGAEFDKAYADHMVNDHKEDVKRYQEASGNLDDPDLKAFAAKTLVILQEHLRMAEEMKKLVEG